MSVTEKMELHVLKQMVCFYEQSGTNTNILNFPFNLRGNAFVKSLPMLQQDNKSYLADVVSSLSKQGLVIKKNTSFTITDEGIDKIINLTDQTKNNSPRSEATNWQNNIPKYIVVGTAITVIGGILLFFIIHLLEPLFQKT